MNAFGWVQDSVTQRRVSSRSMLPFKAAAGQFGPEVRVPGLRVWRVEKMKAVQVPASQLGVFYNGDSYLVLDNRREEGSDLHMWIGGPRPLAGCCRRGGRL